MFKLYFLHKLPGKLDFVHISQCLSKQILEKFLFFGTILSGYGAWSLFYDSEMTYKTQISKGKNVWNFTSVHIA